MSALGYGTTDGWALDPRFVHLNHGSFGAVTTAVAAAQEELRRRALGRPVSWFASQAERVGPARESVCELLAIPRDAGALVLNASAAASVVFSSLPLGAGDEVLLSDHVYGAVAMGAQRWARRAGASLVTVSIPLSCTDDEVVARFEAGVSPRTRVLLVDQISSHTARAFPTARLAAAMRERGVITVVDGSHAPGLVPEPFAASGADLWFGNLHKWWCAPPGAAVMASRPEFADLLWPVIDSWGGASPYPQRFDFVGTADVTAWLVAGDAFRQLDAELGWPGIREHLARTVAAGARVVADALTDATGEPAVVDIPSPALSMRLVRLPGRLGATHAEVDSYRAPMSELTGLECGFGTFGGVGYLRLSAHVYNGPDDYQAFAERGVPLLVRWARQKGN